MLRLAVEKRQNVDNKMNSIWIMYNDFGFKTFHVLKAWFMNNILKTLLQQQLPARADHCFFHWLIFYNLK